MTTVIVTPKNAMPHIGKIWAYLTKDANGDEGLCGAPIGPGGMMMPLIAADPKRLAGGDRREDRNGHGHVGRAGRIRHANRTPNHHGSELMITLNPDGASVKGCTYIYAPKGQAGEYAPLAANPYRGCGHGCAYCYVPLVTKQQRPQFDAGAVGRPQFFARLLRDARRYQAAGITDQVMLSFTTDPYHPGDTKLTRMTLEALVHHGLGFCTLTKGGTRALRDIDLFRPDRDAFASTLTTLDDDFSLKWERKAALPLERIEVLRAFHRRGIFTWVSLEPTLDIESSLNIVDASHEFVDLYKVGRANYLKQITATTDWEGYTLRMIDKLNKLGKRHYIKKDLQKYLPVGYFNPLRVQQHHGPLPGVWMGLPPS